MKIIVLLIALSLAACTAAPIDGCRIFSPIAGSPSQDSPATMAQVDQHNAKGVGACGWRAK